MERNKYREQIQNSIVEPSEDSWEKLSKKLTDHDKKNNKRLFMKYAISIFIITSLGFYLFQPDNEIPRDEIIVSPKVDKTSIKSSLANFEADTTLSAPTENSNVIKIKGTKLLANEIINYDVGERMAPENEDNKEQNKNSLREVHDYFTTNTLNETSKIELHNEDTYEEVEALLKSAYLNIEQNDQYLNEKTISAIDLLGEIEDGIEKDTRRKLFEKIIITIKNPTEIEITDRSK